MVVSGLHFYLVHIKVFVDKIFRSTFAVLNYEL